MASNHSFFVPGLEIKGSRPTTGPLEFYIVTYDPSEWGRRISLLDGTHPPNDDWGTLGAYFSATLAQDTAIEWALKQLQDRLEHQDPPLDTEKARDAAFDEWGKSESRPHEGCWLYTISKGDKSLFTQVEKYTLDDCDRF